MPSVFQIRYAGFKGMLILQPRRSKSDSSTDNALVYFRPSMKKFDSTDEQFCIVEYSKPYTFGRLNEQIVILLHSLGVDDENLMAVQQEYLAMLDNIVSGMFTC